jgi:hypothetical protein
MTTELGPINEDVLDTPATHVGLIEDIKTKIGEVITDNAASIATLSASITAAESDIDDLQTHSTTETQIGTNRYRKRIAVTETFCRTSSTSIAHSITGLSAVHFITGMMIFETPKYYPLPFSDGSATTSLYVTATNLVSVVSGSPTYAGFSSAFIELEYSK